MIEALTQWFESYTLQLTLTAIALGSYLAFRLIIGPIVPYVVMRARDG